MLKIRLCRQRGLVNANDSHLQQTWARVYTNFKSKPFDSQILKNSLKDGSDIFHSRLRPFSIKFQTPTSKATQGLSACFKDSKNVLHEILATRAWKGSAS